MKNKFNKFYQRTIKERHQIIEELTGSSVSGVYLSSDTADQMIENYVTNYQIPLGLATNFTINGRDYIVPMVTEEPSVIAAANNGGKTLGDIKSTMQTRYLIGQIAFCHVENLNEKIKLIESQKDYLLEKAGEFCRSMVERGGGPVDLWAEVKEEFLIVYLSLDSCDAMGANVMNTTLEGIGPEISDIIGQDYLMAILSNYSDLSLVEVSARLPIKKISKDQTQAQEIALKISQASRLAQVDHYRAATHNKGIMNGVDAVVVATGNDWRAVEAGVHSYASRAGSYKGLSQWFIEEDILVGVMQLPLRLGSIGGTISNHPVAQWSLEILGRPNSTQLSQIVASVGLAQNFAALNALVGEGIQKGHMGLQARSLAMQVGASPSEASLIADQLKKEGDISSQRARVLLEKLKKGKEDE